MSASRFEASFNFLSSVKIRRIKEKIASRNDGDIIEACNSVMKCFENDNFVKEAMRSDIPVLLSEALVPRSHKINSAVYQCLRAFCNHKMFYTDGHAFVILQAVCRTGMFLISDEEIHSELDGVLQLLNDVFIGCEIFRISMKNLPVTELQSFLEAITNKTFTCIQTNYQVAVLLNTCLANNDMKIIKTDTKSCVENLIRYFEGIISIAECVNMSPDMDQIIDIACSLAHHLSKTFHCLDENAQKVAKSAIVEFIVTQAVPHFMKIPLHQFEENASGLVALFQCIDTQLDSDVQIAQQLVNAKMLPLVSTIHSNAQNWKNDTLEKISQKLLWRMLASVALEVFPFPAIWPEGRDHFIEEVKSGVLAAPGDPSDWLAALADSTTHRSVKLVVVLFVYFYVLTEGSLSDVNTRAAIARLIENLNPVAPRVIFIKTIWLILAVAEVSNLEEPDQDDVVLTFSTLLESLDDLHVVYTHHPTLLFHVMASSQFSTSLQHQVVHLWLMNQTDQDKSVFNEFLKTSDPGKIVTLNLIQTGNFELLENAYEAVKSLLTDAEDDSVATLVWKILPTACTKICGRIISSENFEKIAELAMMRVPKIFDPLDKSRVVKLFPAAVASMRTPPLGVWRLAHRLLAHFIEENNFYVVTCFTQSESFVEKLLEGFESDCERTVELCLKIAAWLSNAQRREEIPGAAVKAVISLTPILEKMKATQNLNIRHAALLFIHEILESKWDPPLCRITNPPETLTLRVIFSLLLGTAFVDKSDACFECLKTFLIFNQDNETIFSRFIRGANFLHFIVNSLPLLGKSEALVDLLTFWCTVRKPIVPNPRRLCDPFESTVVFLLAEMILQSFRPCMMSMVVQLINGQELIKYELHDKMCQLSETPIESTASEPEEPERVLDFIPVVVKSSPETPVNLLEEFHPPHMEPEDSIVIKQTQPYAFNQFTDFFHTDTRPDTMQSKTAEVIDLTESDKETCNSHSIPNSSLFPRLATSSYMSQDLFDMESIRK